MIMFVSSSKSCPALTGSGEELPMAYQQEPLAIRQAAKNRAGENFP